MTTKPFDPTKPYTTRDGREAKIVHTFNNGDLLIVICDAIVRIHSNGRWSNTGADQDFDLINIPVKRTIEFWVNVYPDTIGYVAYQSKRDSDTASAKDRTECLHIVREYVEGEGLE